VEEDASSGTPLLDIALLRLPSPDVTEIHCAAMDTECIIRSVTYLELVEEDLHNPYT
jgi:hypothetical protein